MIIRPANLADCARLAQLQVDSYRSAYTGIQPPEYLDHFTSVEQEGRWRDCCKRTWQTCCWRRWIWRRL